MEEVNEKKEIKEIFDNLTEGNQDVLKMIAQGMQIAQDNSGKEE